MAELILRITGHIGNDCVVRELDGGKKAINFSVAHSEKFTGKDGVKHEKTTWVDCTYWSDTANVAPYLKKGTLLTCTGTPSTDAFQDKTGAWRSALRLNIDRLTLLDVPGEKNGSAAPAQEQVATGRDALAGVQS